MEDFYYAQIPYGPSESDLHFTAKCPNFALMTRSKFTIKWGSINIITSIRTTAQSACQWKTHRP